jgi:hypothetical protein
MSCFFAIVSTSLSLAQDRYREYEDTGMPSSSSGSSAEFLALIGAAVLFGIGYAIPKIDESAAKILSVAMVGVLVMLASLGGDGAGALAIFMGVIVFAGFLFAAN